MLWRGRFEELVDNLLDLAVEDFICQKGESKLRKQILLVTSVVVAVVGRHYCDVVEQHFEFVMVETSSQNSPY